MQIPSKLQTEIVEYLYLEKQKLPKPPKLSNDSSKNDVIAASMHRGMLLGLDRAMMILNNWNMPNKGKVTVQLNSTEKQKIEKEYEVLTPKQEKCSACGGTGFSEESSSQFGFLCSTCKGTGKNEEK